MLQSWGFQLLAPNMSRYTESRELVQTIGREILAEGRGVTNAEVSAKIFERAGRRVSPNLVTEELQRFWALIGTELAQRHHIPDIPAGVVLGAQAFWNQAVEAADARWSAAKADITATLETVQAKNVSLSTQLDDAHSQYRQAESLLRTERAAHTELVARFGELQEQAQTHAQAHVTIQAQAVALENQLTSAQQSLTWQQQAHTKELEAMHTRLDYAQKALAAQASALDAGRLAQEQLQHEVSELRRGREDDQRALAAEALRAERLVLQVQALERQERATRRTRVAPTRRRAKP